MKHKFLWPILLTITMLPGVALAGRPLLHQKTNQNKNQNQIKRVRQLNRQSPERFLRETEQGRIVLAYLRCTDFDCVETLRSVVNLGRDVVLPLNNLLAQNAPRMIAPDLPQNKLTLLVRVRVISALGELKDERAVAVLLAARQTGSPEIRAACAEAFGKIGGERSLAALISFLRDNDHFVRETAANSLGRLKPPQALAALHEAARKESLPHVRKAMEAAIKSIEQH